MADERTGMMEGGKATSDVRQGKKSEEKEGRKRKQVELLMVAIRLLPG